MHDIVLAGISHKDRYCYLIHMRYSEWSNPEKQRVQVVASSSSRKIDSYCSIDLEFQFGICAGLFFVNLTYARVIWEERISVEKRPNLIGL